TALSLLRRTEPLRAPAVLHAARVGVEGQSARHVHELESECDVRRVQRRQPITRATAPNLARNRLQSTPNAPRTWMILRSRRSPRFVVARSGRCHAFFSGVFRIGSSRTRTPLAA